MMNIQCNRIIPLVALVCIAVAPMVSAYTETIVEQEQRLAIFSDDYGVDDSITVKGQGLLYFRDTEGYDLGKITLEAYGTLSIKVDGSLNGTTGVAHLAEFNCLDGSMLELTLMGIQEGLNYVLFSCDKVVSGTVLPSLALGTTGSLSWVDNKLVYTAPGGSPRGIYFNPVSKGATPRGFYSQYSAELGYSSAIGESEWREVRNFSQELNVVETYIKLEASEGETVTARGILGNSSTQGVLFASGDVMLDSSMSTANMGKIFVIGGRLHVNGSTIANEVNLGASQATYKGSGFALFAEGSSTFSGLVNQIEETGVLLGSGAILNFDGTYTSSSKLKLKLAEAGSSATVHFSTKSNTVGSIYVDEGAGKILLSGNLAVSALEVGREGRLDISGASLTGLSHITLGDFSGLTIASSAMPLVLQTFINGRNVDITLAGGFQAEMDRGYNILTASTQNASRNRFMTVTVNGYHEYASWGTMVDGDKTVDVLTYRPSYYWTGESSVFDIRFKEFTNAAGKDRFGWKNGNNLVLGDYAPELGSVISVIDQRISIDTFIVRGPNHYTLDASGYDVQVSANQTILEENASLTLLTRDSASFMSNILMKSGSSLILGSNPDNALGRNTQILGSGTIELNQGGSMREFVYRMLSADGGFSGVLRVGKGATLNAALDVSQEGGAPSLADINSRLANTMVEVVAGGNMTVDVKYTTYDPKEAFTFNLTIAGSGYKDASNPEHEAALSFIGGSGTKFSGALTLNGDSTIYVKEGISGAITGSIKSINPKDNLTKTGGGELILHKNEGWSGDLIIDGGKVTLEGFQAMNVQDGKCVNGIILKNGIFDLSANKTNDNSFLLAKDLTFAGAGDMTVKGYRGLGFHPGYSKVVYAEGASGKALITANISEVYTYGNGPLEFNVAKSAQQGNSPELTVSGNVGKSYGEGSAYAFGILKTGEGKMLLSGDNAYVGGTMVRGGTLVAGSARALGGGDVTVSDGSVLVMDAAVALNVGKTVSVEKGGFLQMTTNGNLTANLLMKSGSILDTQANTCFSGSISIEPDVFLHDRVMDRAVLGTFSGQNDVVVLNSFSVKVGAGQSLSLAGTTWHGTQMGGFEQGRAYELMGDASLIFKNQGGSTLDLSDFSVWITYTGADYLITLSSAGKDKIFFNTADNSDTGRGFYKQHTDQFGYKRTVMQDDWTQVNDFSNPLDVSSESDVYIKLDASSSPDNRVVASGRIGYGGQAGNGTKGTWITGGTVTFAPDIDIESAGNIFAVDGTLEVSGESKWTNDLHLGSNGDKDSLVLTGESASLSNHVELMETSRLGVSSATKGQISGVISGIGNSGLVKTGEGVLLLSGENTWKGGTRVEEGKLVAGSYSSLGTGNVTVCNGGVLELASSLRLSGEDGGVSTITVLAGGVLSGDHLMGMIHANLLLESGSILNVSQSLAIDQSWTIQAGTVLTDSFLSKQERSRNVGEVSLLIGEIISGQSFTLGGKTYDYEFLLSMKDMGPMVIEPDAGSIFQLQEGSVYDLNNCPIYADVSSGASSDVLNYRVYLLAVPEPSSALLGLVGMAALFLHRRRVI